MKQRLVSATEFKAKCLAILDDIDRHGGTITVTKRGRPVATLGPAKKQIWKSPMGVLEGKIEILGDIVNTALEWDCVRGE